MVALGVRLQLPGSRFLSLKTLKALSMSLLLTHAATGMVPAAVARSHQQTKAEDAEALANKHSIGDDVPIEVWRDVSVTPWAVLLCIHGLSLHAKSYESFGRAMSHLGLPTYAMDVRGFGSWQNAQGVGRLDFADTFSDIKNSLLAIRRVNPGLPLVIVGESMGGAIALQATAANPDLIDGLICSVPSRRNNGQKTTNLKAALGLLYSPNGEISVSDKVIKKATQDSTVADEWERDPMTRKSFTPRELLQFRNLMNTSRAKAELINKTPVLFLQGGSDKLIKPTGTVELFNHLKTPDKDLVMVGTAQHLILERGQFGEEKIIKDDVISLVTNWIDKHVANPENVAEDKENAENSGNAGNARVSANSMETNADITRQARGHYKIAEGSMLLNDPEMAKDHLLTVIRMARGTAIAQKADQMLLTLPEPLIAPPINETKHGNAQLVSISAAKANDKPSVLIFCAPWIESCKTILDELRTALGENEDKVNVVYIDADKRENEALLEEYGVKPLPAVLYLNSKNQVLLYTLASPSLAVWQSRVRQLLDAEAKLKAQEK
ncbi:MAG: alpha/beta fold hydrolase [Cyanobacteria bacterium REEB67]|nr:alpha/beta fold hydrolase [Cyanobacteria bacterium REEB67]